MADENSTTMNLDVSVEAHDDDGAMSLHDWLEFHFRRTRGSVQHTYQRSRTFTRQHPVLPETSNLSMETNAGIEPQTGQEVSKWCDRCSARAADDLLAKKEDGGKISVDGGVFYNCNICLDLAKDPVVTACGHLFCWPCLHRWLNRPSVAKECPVCKGEVSVKSVTPIYGRGDCIQEPNSGSAAKIPVRPQAQRVECSRQTSWRPVVGTTLEELIGLSGSTSDIQSASH